MEAEAVDGRLKEVEMKEKLTPVQTCYFSREQKLYFAAPSAANNFFCLLLENLQLLQL